jgi:opacity protein-like surface antigen
MTKNKPGIFLLIMSALLCGRLADAATLYLRDQTTVEGTIVSATARDMQVNTAKGLVTIDTDRISRIDYTAQESARVEPMGAADPPVRAEEPLIRPYRLVNAEQNFRQNFSFGLGAMVPLSRVDFTSTGGGTDANGGSGILFSGRYLYNLTPRLSIGPDVGLAHRAATGSQSLLPESNTDVFGNTFLLMGTAKLSLVNEGPVRPYLLGGLGANRTSTIVEATPNPGFGWSDTNTTETRTLADQSRWGLATHLAFGLDFPFFDATFFGLEVGWTYLDNPHYDATRAGQDVGLTSVTGIQHMLTIAARWGWRF